MNRKILKIVCLATLAFFALTAEGCPQEGGGHKAKEATTPVITKSGEYTIGNDRGQVKRRKLNALRPTSACHWWLMWDIPGYSGKAVILAEYQSESLKKTTANLNMKKSFTYKIPGTNNRVVARNKKPTSFITKGCGYWYK